MNFKAFLSFCSQFYDRVLAVIVLLLFVVCVGLLVVRIKTIETDVRLEEETQPKVMEASPVALKSLVTASEMLSNPPVWSTNANHRLFIAPLMKVLDPNDPFPSRYNAEKIGEMLTSEGLPFRWLQKYGLPTGEPVANTDPDGDGFTVREEYEAGTDPADPKSHPDIAFKLRVVRLLQRPFPFIFNGTNEASDGKSFSIQRSDGSVCYYVKVGGMVPDKLNPGYKIVNFTEKSEMRPSPTIKGYQKKVDLSEVTLQRAGQKPVVLVKDKTAMSDDLTAQLYFILEDRTFEVAPGSVINLQDSVYQVVSIKMLDGGVPEVLVKKENSDQHFRLRMLLPDELKKNRTASFEFPSPGAPVN